MASDKKLALSTIRRHHWRNRVVGLLVITAYILLREEILSALVEKRKAETLILNFFVRFWLENLQNKKKVLPLHPQSRNNGCEFLKRCVSSAG